MISSSRASESATRLAPDALEAEVLAGLRADPKTLPPKLFYDATGAELFEQICEQPEYYLTRAELEILRHHARELASLVGSDGVLIEYGSGAGTKIRVLLDALTRPACYVPIDVSRRQLARVSASIGVDYPELQVVPVCADYTGPFSMPTLAASGRRIAFYPGSTIGNFHPTEAATFLRRIRRLVGPEGGLILGVDRRKDARLLHAAYNDAAGVTAAFNANILARLNRELGSDFDLDAFHHLAFYDERAGRVEMHLVSAEGQTVSIGESSIRFRRGETIWTESSYKYDEASLTALVDAAGFRVERLFTDRAGLFWVAYLT